MGTLEPVWDFMCEFEIVEIDDSPIDIEVYDDDYGKDSSEGSYSLTLDEAINDLVVKGKWYNLEGCKTGKVFISAIYAPKDDEIEEANEIKNTSDNEEIKEDKQDISATSIKSDGSGLDASEVKDMFTMLKQIPNSQEKEIIIPQDKKEYKEESGAAVTNVIPKEDEIIDHKTEAKSTSFKSDDFRIDDSEVKEIPQSHEKEAFIDEDTKLDTVDIKPGVLTLTIHKASQLENLDVIGKSDPYVKIKFNDLELTSKTIKNSLEPEWNFSNDFEILENQNKNIDITVYDSDIGKDNIEGSFILPVQEAIKNADKEASWYNLTGSKSGKLFISSKFAENQAPANVDDVDGPEDFCDNKQEIQEKEMRVDDDKNKIEIPSIRKEGEDGDGSVDIDEDTDKHDDDISESDYSYVTVADLSRKEDVSQSETDDQNKLQKEKETNSKEDRIDEGVSTEAPKGLMASIKSTVGGFFYGEKVPKEETKEEKEKESGSNESVT